MNDNSEKIVINDDDINSVKFSASQTENKVIINVSDLYKKDTGISRANIEEKSNGLQDMRRSSSIGKILSIAALVIACIVVVYYVAKPNYQHSIEAVLVADKNISVDLKDRPAVEAVTIVVQRMRSMNLSSCPAEFQKAYQRHTDAWRNAIPVLQAAEKQNGWGNILTSAVIGFVGGYTGNFGLVADKMASDVNASGELNQAASKVDEEIKSTFNNVLKIAQCYGVDVTPYKN